LVEGYVRTHYGRRVAPANADAPSMHAS